MNFFLKIPGPILIFLGACCLSFGGIVVKSFEGANLWQILFWRSVFFSIGILIFLLFNYKLKLFESIKKSGIWSLIGGIFLASGYAGYVFAMYNTTVANTNFIIQTQAIFLAIFGYIFLKEKISKITLLSIILAFFGIILMLGSSLSPGEMQGNIVAFFMPISFAALILIVRKNPNVDMIPLHLIAGIVAIIIGYLFSKTILISVQDIFLAFIAGFFQVGLGFILITIGARTTTSAMVGILMLTEAVLGPIWAWIILKENPPLVVLVGGAIVILAVIIRCINFKVEKKFT